MLINQLKMFLVLLIFLFQVSYATNIDIKSKTDSQLFKSYIVATSQQKKICPVPNFSNGIIYRLANGFKEYLKEAKTGNITAQYYVGIAYYTNLGTNYDIPKAVYWLEKAAAKNYTNAMYQLGLLYTAMGNVSIGKNLHAKENHQKAYKWLKMCAMKNNAKCAMTLAYFQFYGINVKQNRLKARAIIKKYTNEKNVFAQIAQADMIYFNKETTEYPHALNIYKKKCQ